MKPHRNMSNGLGVACFCVIAATIIAMLAVWKVVEILFWICKKVGIE